MASEDRRPLAPPVAEVRGIDPEATVRDARLSSDPLAPDLSGGSSVSKHPLQSKTLFGALAMALPIFTRALGLELSEPTAQLVLDLVALLLGLPLTVVGRLTAKQPLSLTPRQP